MDILEYGECPDCGTPLQNWGAASDGDGDIYDEIGCPLCEEVKEKRHATYCHCPECDPYYSLCTICGTELESEECDRCGGEGFVEYDDAPETWGEDCPSEINHLVTCPECHGQGYFNFCPDAKNHKDK